MSLHRTRDPAHEQRRAVARRLRTNWERFHNPDGEDPRKRRLEGNLSLASTAAAIAFGWYYGVADGLVVTSIALILFGIGLGTRDIAAWARTRRQRSERPIYERVQ